MLPDQCIVIRDGSHTAISAIDLVPGDIVVVKQGNKLPADVRFVEASSDAMFDRAILTGKTKLRRAFAHMLTRLTQASRNPS
jgi:sodium/potassium-transporting ATPase subunit alpha